MISIQNIFNRKKTHDHGYGQTTLAFSNMILTQEVFNQSLTKSRSPVTSFLSPDVFPRCEAPSLRALQWFLAVEATADRCKAIEDGTDQGFNHHLASGDLLLNEK